LKMEKEFIVKDVIEIVRKGGYHVTRNMLINYERNKLISPRYSKGGYRVYSSKDIDDILLICSLLDINWPIKEISSLLSFFIKTKDRIVACQFINEALGKVERGIKPKEEQDLERAFSLWVAMKAEMEVQMKELARVLEVSERKSIGVQLLNQKLKAGVIEHQKFGKLFGSIMARCEKPAIQKMMKSLGSNFFYS
jgi:DNA-binding transcriptional MerR regulator